MLSSDLLTKHVTREVMNVITGMTIGQLFGIDDTEPQLAPRVPKRKASKRKPTKRNAAKASSKKPAQRVVRSSKVFGNQMAKVMSALKSGPMAISELATATKLPVEALKLPLEKLMAAGDVRKTGNRRTTRYHLATRPKAK